MTTGAAAVRTAAAARQRHQQAEGPWLQAWRRLLHHRLAMGALLTLALIIVGVVLGPVVTGYDPTRTSLLERFTPPSATHWFGTDEIGRDTFTRVMLGGRISLMVGLVVGIGAVLIGVLVGTVAGYRGGLLDNLLMRVVDVGEVLPRIVILLVMARVLGPGLLNVILILVVLEWTRAARLMRGMILSLREQTFIEAARAVGASGWRISVQHLVPNCIAPLIVETTLMVGYAIRAEAILSFLGLGIQPPMPSWGNLLSNASQYFYTAPWQVYIPGFCIFVTLVTINLLGDGLRDALDPRQTR